MNETFKKLICESTGASDLYEMETIQELWSGYGQIMRYGLKGSKYQTVIIKHIDLPRQNKHPRGWNTDKSHKRKVRSYQVETAWYEQYSEKCDAMCRVPCYLASKTQGNESLIVLEDLDAAGYPKRKQSASWNEMQLCLNWLANFHATYMGEKPVHLWKTGTYWHLETRPDELKALTDKSLKQAAAAIDKKLKQSAFQTFVHGDAKLANFCYSRDNKNVAAVDFQYVGGGCGMKDVAYFVGSCLYEEQCERMEEQVLSYYFSCLEKALIKKERDIDVQALETEWRALYPTAWADFHRFLKGWSPGHWKINSYSEKVTRKVVQQLDV